MTKRQVLDREIMQAVQRYRIDSHKSVEEGINEAISLLKSHKRARPKIRLMTASEWRPKRGLFSGFLKRKGVHDAK